MKKVFLGLVMAFAFAGYAKAGISEGYAGSFANEKIWYSSYTCSDDVPVRAFSTGTVIIGYVQVLSTGSASTIQFVKSTQTDAGNYRFYSSAATPSPIDTFNPSATMIYVMQISSTGWGYTTTSQDSKPAKLRILWDYFISR